MKLKLFDIGINLIYLNISNYQYGHCEMKLIL